MTNADRAFIFSFTNDIIEQDDTLKYETVLDIVTKNHASNGYFSWDGILDDLTEIIGYNRAHNILSNC